MNSKDKWLYAIGAFHSAKDNEKQIPGPGKGLKVLKVELYVKKTGKGHGEMAIFYFTMILSAKT